MYKFKLNVIFKKATSLFFLFLLACNTSQPTLETIQEEDAFIRAADMSFVPLILSENYQYLNANNQVENPLLTLQKAGCNTIRIRLWVNPVDATSSLGEVKMLAQQVRNLKMKVWLCIHYSDTWADPGSQTTPSAWANFSFLDLKQAVSIYTTTAISEIKPEIVQIGNEINSGFMWPNGHLYNQESQCLQLLAAASAAVRAQSPSTKIMLHYAGIGADANLFFNKLKTIDYDYIGLSFYPIWHGKNLGEVTSTINTLGQNYAKKVIIAETSYPFTLGFNDFTNNVLGLDSQIMSAYPATNDGQFSYLKNIKTAIKTSSHGIGFCYWGAEWVAFRGSTSSNGSSWENQALWDFNKKALPAMGIFSR